MDSRQRAVEARGIDPSGLGLVALLVIVGALAWFAGRVSLLLCGKTQRHTPAGRAPLFLWKLGSGRDAGEAWRRTYPLSVRIDDQTFWATFVALAAITCIAGTVLVLTWPRNVGSDDEDEGASWASKRDERRIAVRRSPGRRRWRLVAGRGDVSHRLLAADDCVSAVAFGPNGSGKTTGLIVPNVLDWDGPVVLTTAKPQDLEPICSARSGRGPVWVIAPGGAGRHPTVGWSPVKAAVDPDTADRIAEWMVESSGMTGDPKGRPWNAQARKYLKGLLLASHVDGGGMQQWVTWIHAGERARDTVDQVLRGAGYDDVAQDYGSTWQIHEDGKGSVLFTALGLADTYARPGIRDAAQRGGFTTADFFNKTGTLCIVTPSSEGERFAPYFTTLVSSIIHAAEVEAARRAGPIEPRLLLALDEAGNVFRYPRLPHLLTTARGNGIQLLLIYHDLAQIEHVYGGREVARTVVSNAKMRMLLPGVGDLETLRYWSELLGRTRVQRHGTSTGDDGKRTQSRNDHDDYLVPLHRLQQLPDGEAVLLYQNLPPARVRLLPWYADRRFRHLRRST